MYKREKFLAERDDNRVVRPFEWGKEFADTRFIDNLNGSSPQSFFEHYSQNAVQNSDEFFALSEILDFDLKDLNLTWTSQTVTDSPVNNTVRARYFPVEKQHERKRAVIVLPHWNAPAESYFALCKVFNRIGISALRLTLPYHEERMPPEHDRADFLVSPNIGRTLQSIRQAILDTRAAASWLKSEGFERVGIVGTSIGSATAFLAMIHDSNINAAVYNHVSGYVADVVWRGVSTYHVRAGLEREVSLEEVRQFWLPISPMAYMDKVKNLPARPMRFIYTLYDLTFPLDLSQQMMSEFRRRGIPHDETILPCGHYTLGEAPWVYLDGWKIVNFLRKNL
ncbi:MAG: abhydrolase domain-containing 18 [Pyrinomonadaceae bacterium]